MPAAASQRLTAAPPPGEQVSLGSYTTYPEAQSVVDYLADHHFEVETTQIVGSDLRMVEQVTGRLACRGPCCPARPAARGSASSSACSFSILNAASFCGQWPGASPGVCCSARPSPRPATA
jgi:hypothetical protein